MKFNRIRVITKGNQNLIEFLYPLLIFFSVLALLDNSTALYWKIVTVIALLVCPFIIHFSISYLCTKNNINKG